MVCHYNPYLSQLYLHYIFIRTSSIITHFIIGSNTFSSDIKDKYRYILATMASRNIWVGNKYINHPLI